MLCLSASDKCVEVDFTHAATFSSRLTRIRQMSQLYSVIGLEVNSAGKTDFGTYNKSASLRTLTHRNCGGMEIPWIGHMFQA